MILSVTARESLKTQLKRDEGAVVEQGRHRLYQDSKGLTTVGWGRNIQDRGLSFDESEYLLANDMRDAINDVETMFPWTSALDEVRFSVLVNMAFMGIGKLRGFVRMLAALQGGDYAEAARQILDSKYHQDVGDRAVRLAKQMVTGQWQ